MKTALRNLIFVVVLVVITGSAYAATSLIPRLHNPDFEIGVDGWGWMINNGAKTGFKLISDNPHGGKNCMLLWNETGVVPNVYGRFSTACSVLPDTQYELSVWVRGKDVKGAPQPSHFTDWNSYGINIPEGTYDWQKISTTFKTKPDQWILTIGLNMGNAAKELVIDDLMVKPVGTELKGEGVTGSFLAPARVIGDNASGYLGIDLKAEKAVAVMAEVSSGSTVLFKKRAQLKSGENWTEWEWNSGKVPPGKIDCNITVIGEQGVIATASGQTDKVASATAEEINLAEARFKGEFMNLYKRCQEKKIPLDYPTTTKTMLEQFIPLAKEDVQKGHDWRAEGAAKDFRRALDESISEMKAYLADPRLAPNAVRYQTGKVKIDGLSHIGPRKDSNGKKSQGPIFFNGYGHFGQIQTDMDRWPGYAINLLQTGILGPAQTLVSEDKVSLNTVNDVIKLLDDSAKKNVRVDVLLSPHYFPQWALDKWPHIGKASGHFINFEVDAPEAKQVIEKFIRLVVPMMKDKPALHSFCLSNEPVFNNTANANNTKPLWKAYLQKVHGDLKIMNERYGTSYKSYEEVPIPGNESYDDPQFYDYVSFNNERFAAWHAWMAELVHEIAPNVPVHSKLMSMAIPHRFTASWGCDPELFADFSDMNGNDCLIRGPIGHGWFLPFHLQNMTYDLQRSLARKPIFNSENHPTDDRSTYYVNPEHFRTTFWQGAVHGQGSTTTWVWEHSFDKNSDLYGNVMDRPGCALATSRTTLDMNRFAGELTALQNVKSPVAFIFSTASICRNKDYQGVLYQAYCALNFLGIKIDFISERQLQQGKGKEYKMIILPHSTNVLPATFQAVKGLPETTKLVIIGDSLIKDPWNKEYPAEELKAIRDKAVCMAGADAEKVLRPALQQELAKINALSDVQVVDASTGEFVWGVEWLPVEYRGKTLVNIVNLTDKRKRVKILVSGREVGARDLLSLGGRDKVGTLKPGSPVLAEIKE